MALVRVDTSPPTFLPKFALVRKISWLRHESIKELVMILKLIIY